MNTAFPVTETPGKRFEKCAHAESLGAQAHLRPCATGQLRWACKAASSLPMLV